MGKVKSKRYEEIALKKGLNITPNRFKLLLPSFLAFLAWILKMTGLIYIAPSIYQMIGGGTIIFLSLFSTCFLKRKLDVHHFLGVILAIIGLTLLSYSSFHNTPVSEKGKNYTDS